MVQSGHAINPQMLQTGQTIIQNRQTNQMMSHQVQSQSWINQPQPQQSQQMFIQQQTQQQQQQQQNQQTNYQQYQQPF